MDSPSQVLNRAAALLKSKGWRQGLSIKQGPYCIIAAVSSCIPQATYNYNLHTLCREIRKTLNWKDRLSTWNDQPGRTKEEVIQALRQTAIRLDGEAAIATGDFK